ncbi:MAG: ATP synthase F1 subunit epsilon [Candidatus Latescibacteria bacterium]|nr:ATP synthase F1 subunit epsilon [Candidatus Latescibacterota bacterium]
MANSFKVTITTAEQQLLETDSVSLTLPGIAGYLGIWANHAPLVTALVPGVMTLRHNDSGAAGTVSHFAVSRGFVEVADNRVSVMVDSCEPSDQIDVTRAEAALERAKKLLQEPASAKVDVARAEAALERAKARLVAARKNK